MKLNANRQVAGVLRGFDPFMNLVLDETVEKIKDGVVNSIGMVVCFFSYNTNFINIYITYIKIN